MSGEHTPGEWVIGSANMVSDQPAIYSESGEYLATVEPNPGHEAMHANARLIAAAPNMEDALVSAEAALAVASSYVTIEQRRMQDTLEIVRDALAKARGGA